MSISLRKVDPAWLFTQGESGLVPTPVALDWAYMTDASKKQYTAAADDAARKIVQKEAQSDWLRSRRQLIKAALASGAVDPMSSKLYKPRAKKPKVVAETVSVETAPIVETTPPAAVSAVLANDPPRRLKLKLKVKPLEPQTEAFPAPTQDLALTTKKRSRWDV